MLYEYKKESRVNIIRVLIIPALKMSSVHWDIENRWSITKIIDVILVKL